MTATKPFDDPLTQRLTALARDLILIRSTHEHPDERRRGFQLLQNHLDALESVNVETYMCDGFESLVARPPGIAAPEVLLCAHLDAIEHPHEETYASHIRDGRITGPGAGDMKGSLATLLELFLQIHLEHPGASLGLAVTSDEELGGECGFRYLFDDIGLRCGVAVLPDGGSLNKVTVEEKGILHVLLRRRGQAGHAARPWLGSNPIQPMMRQIARIEDWFQQFGPHDPPPPDGEHWFPTYSPTIVRTDNEAVNRIPDTIETILDIRFPRPTTVNGMLEDLRALLDPETELDVIISAEPSHLDPDPRYLEITEQITGAFVHRVRTSGGSDARFIAAHGIPVLVSRPIVGNLHAADEWIDIRSMTTHFRICEAYVRERLRLN